MRVLHNIFTVCEILILFSILGRDAVDKQAKDLVIEQITKACKDAGFFYLSGHGVEKSSLNQIFTATKNFFALPLEKKNAINVRNSPLYSGYTETSML